MLDTRIRYMYSTNSLDRKSSSPTVVFIFIFYFFLYVVQEADEENIE